jgi:xanthine dehydrogenase accessory factor
MTDELLGVGMPCGGIMDVYIEPVLPKPELLIVGHGRIAETLAALGSLVGFRMTGDDPGAERQSFPGADRLITDDLDLSAPAIGSQTYIVIATQHKGDHLSLKKALESKAAYIALVSSRHRAALGSRLFGGDRNLRGEVGTGLGARGLGPWRFDA